VYLAIAVVGFVLSAASATVTVWAIFDTHAVRKADRPLAKKFAEAQMLPAEERQAAFAELGAQGYLIRARRPKRDASSGRWYHPVEPFPRTPSGCATALLIWLSLVLITCTAGFVTRHWPLF
jgi:hypothetical protein